MEKHSLGLYSADGLVRVTAKKGSIWFHIGVLLSSSRGVCVLEGFTVVYIKGFTRGRKPKPRTTPPRLHFGRQAVQSHVEGSSLNPKP